MNRKNPWLVFLLPFFVFALVGAFEPTPEKTGGGMIGLSIPYSQYPLVYTLKIIFTVAAVIFVLPGYREFPFRISPLAVGVGVVGVVLWVGICRLDVEHRWLQPVLEKVGLGGFIGAGDRAGFNPLEQLKSQPLWAWTFLVIRFTGLALVVPIIEEFFLRGFVMRFVMEKDWWKTPFGTVNRLAIILGTAVPMLMHPGELLAAAVWFSLVTWLMLRTKNIWDCVIAHAVTNFLLGVYVVWMGGEAWRLM
jgi:CAAX prenyl protease-like protein